MNYFKKNIEQYKKDLSRLISFNTVLKDEYPSQGMRNALKFMGELAERDGLEYKIDEEGYYGWIQIGSGEELIGILTHVDVVPEGDLSKWDNNPFTLTELDNKLYGRGTQDDKGPLMLMYYLLLEYKDLVKGKRVRLIFPTDEESKWRGIEKYKQEEEHPAYGFTPDSQFPVTFLEREIVQVELIGETSDDFVIKGGTAANVVPSYAVIEHLGVKKEAEGVSTHAQNPKNGINAITKLVRDIPETTLDHPMINFIRNEVMDETNGKKLFGELIKDQYSEITVNLAVVEINSETSRIVIDSRVPLTSNADDLLNRYKKQGDKYGFEPRVIKNSKSVYVPEDNWLVKDLVDAYNTTFNEDIKPVFAGGGTYAKSLDNILAFGPLLPTSEHTMHQYNEYINLDDYEKAYDVYCNLFDKWLK